MPGKGGMKEWEAGRAGGKEGGKDGGKVGRREDWREGRGGVSRSCSLLAYSGETLLLPLARIAVNRSADISLRW